MYSPNLVALGIFARDDNDSNCGGVVFSGGGAGGVWCALVKADAGSEEPGRCLEQGGAVSFHSRDCVVCARAFWSGESWRVVVAFRRHNYFQRQFVRDGIDRSALVRSDHPSWRALFSGGVCVAGYFAV